MEESLKEKVERVKKKMAHFRLIRTINPDSKEARKINKERAKRTSFGLVHWFEHVHRVLGKQYEYEVSCPRCQSRSVRFYSFKEPSSVLPTDIPECSTCRSSK